MIRSSLVSALTLVSSVAALAVFGPACSSTSKGGSGFDNPSGTNPGGGNDASTGTGDDDTSGDGGTSPGHFGNDGGTSTVDSGLQSCATAQATASRTPVYMLFVLDASGSMAWDGSGNNATQNRWTAATGALNNIFADMKTKADPGIGAGLNVFSGIPATDVPIAFVDATQESSLVSRTANDAPLGGTPTSSALSTAYAELGTYAPKAPLAAGGKKVVVLITDGVPSDGCSTDPAGTDDYTKNSCVVMAGNQAKSTPPAGPIETFVIGVGHIPETDFGNYDPYFLGALALAGGSGPAGCDPKSNAAGATNGCYFAVDVTAAPTALTAAFEKAIDNIRGQVSSCTFALNLSTDGGAIDPTKVNVTLNGTTIPQDPINGWTYDNANNPTSVTLHGTSCATVTSTPSSTVSVVLGCVTVLPPPAK